MAKTKITDNKKFNVYECNNSGMFACIDYYTVGKEDWTDQFDFSIRKDLAKEICDRLNQEVEDNTCPGCEKEYESDESYDDGKTIICFRCGHEKEKL